MRVKSIYMGINIRISLVVQWLRFYASTGGVVESIAGQETKIPHARWYDQKVEKKQKAKQNKKKCVENKLWWF